MWNIMDTIVNPLIKKIFHFSAKNLEAERNADKELYLSLIKVLPSDNTISFLENFYNGPFLRERLDGFERFMHFSDNPERQFIDKALRKRQEILAEAIKGFLSYI